MKAIQPDFNYDMKYTIAAIAIFILAGLGIWKMVDLINLLL